jgi:hypothetical protein
MIHRRFLVLEQLRQEFLGNPGVEGVAAQRSLPPARDIPSEIFYSFPNGPPGYCQNQNVMKNSTATTQNAIANGFKTTARSSDVGYATPQQWQTLASASTGAAQYLHFDLRIASFALFQNGLSPKPECAEDRYCKSVKLKCSRAQDDRSEFW